MVMMVGLIMRDVWLSAIGALGLIYVGVLWLLAPYSKAAWRLVRPDVATFDRRVARIQALADAPSRVPIFGALWRWGQRLSAPMTVRTLSSYRRSLDAERLRKP
jgi:hypothetical protein